MYDQKKVGLADVAAILLGFKKAPIIARQPATKRSYNEKIEYTLSVITKPMTLREITEETGYAENTTYKWLVILEADGKIKRTNRKPYHYFKA